MALLLPLGKRSEDHARRARLPRELFNHRHLQPSGSICAMFMVLFIVGVAGHGIRLRRPAEDTDKIGGLPWYVLIFAVLVGSNCEELFFRALLSPRFGIIASADPLRALARRLRFGGGDGRRRSAIGLVLGAIYKMSKSITPCILVAHGIQPPLHHGDAVHEVVRMITLGIESTAHTLSIGIVAGWRSRSPMS